MQVKFEEMWKWLAEKLVKASVMETVRTQLDGKGIHFLLTKLPGMSTTKLTSLRGFGRARKHSGFVDEAD